MYPHPPRTENYTLSLHDALPIFVDELWAHRKKFKDVAAEQDTKLTFLPYIVKAVVAMMKEFPVFNASLDDTTDEDRKSTRLNSSHVSISYAVFCLKKKKSVIQRS